MPSKPLIAQARGHGVEEVFYDLKTTRKGYGLHHGVRPTVAMASKTAQLLGLMHEDPVLPMLHLSTRDVANRLMTALDVVKANRSLRILAQAMWNTPVPRIRVPELDAITSSSLVLKERVARLAQLNAKTEDVLLPKTWLSSERAFREVSDQLLLDIALTLPRHRTSIATRLVVATAEYNEQSEADNVELGTSAVMDELMADATRFVTEADPSPQSIADLDDHADILSQGYSFIQPGVILGQARELKRRIDLLLTQAHEPSRRESIYLILGKVHGVLSYATLDLGNPVAAKQHAEAVEKAGRFAASDEAQAWGLGTQSMILRFNQQFESSLDPVIRARSLDISPMMRARVNGQLILGYSELRESGEVERFIGETQDLMERVAEGDDRNFSRGIFGFPLSKFHYYAGSGLLGLGESYGEAAFGHSSLAVELFQHGSEADISYSDELLARIHQATAQLRKDRLDAVPEALERLFKADVGSRTSWHSQWLGRLNRFLETNPRYEKSAIQKQLQDLTDRFNHEIQFTHESGELV